MMPVKKAIKKSGKVSRKPKFESYTVHIAKAYADRKAHYKDQLAAHKKTSQKLKDFMKSSKSALVAAEKKLVDVKTKNKGKSGVTAKTQIARVHDQVRQLETQRMAAKQELQMLRVSDDRIKNELAQLVSELKHLLVFRKKRRHEAEDKLFNKSFNEQESMSRDGQDDEPAHEAELYTGETEAEEE